MIERRIRVPKDKEDLVTRLTKSDDYPNGPFEQRSDVLTFAAAYGHRHDLYKPFSDTSTQISIRPGVFERRGQDFVFYLLALAKTRDPRVLSDTDEAIDRRAIIFEAYANGGLEALRPELHGLDDPLGRLILLVGEQRSPETERPAGIDTLLS